MKWFYSKNLDLTDWVMAMFGEGKRLGKSFLLNIFYSGDTLPPNQLANHICQLYGKKNIKEIHFGNLQKALVVLVDPLSHDAMVMKFKSCMFAYRSPEQSGKRKPEKEYMRIDVYNIFPMAGVVEFNIEGGMRLSEMSRKYNEKVFNVLAKLMQLLQPCLLSHRVYTDWEGKESDDKDLVIRFFSIDVRRCREFFLKEQRQIHMYDKEYNVFYTKCVPAFTFGQNVKFPTVELPEFTCIKW